MQLQCHTNWYYTSILCCVSCVLWEGCAGSSVICVLSWFGKSTVIFWVLVQRIELYFTGYSMSLTSHPHISPSGLPDVAWLLFNLQTEDSAMHMCRSSTEQVFFCGWLLSAEESLFFFSYISQSD